MNKRKTSGKYSIIAVLIILIAYFLINFGYSYFSVSEPVNELSDVLSSVYYIDVGQGDSTIIQAGDFNVLIDAGESSRNVVEYIEKLGITRFDYVIATHPHSDHIGGMADIIFSYEIDNFIMPDVTHTTQAFESMIFALEKSDANVIAAEPGYEFGSDNAMFTIIGPNSMSYDDLNNYSVSLIMDCSDVSFLFTGDAESLAEKEMMEGFNVSADIYHVAHHGSSTSSTNVFMNAVNPSFAIISCGKDNSYGHPHNDVVDILENKNATVLRTDLMGTIEVHTDGYEYVYICEK